MARELGPQVFIDTFPSALNALLIVLVGNVLVQDPGSQAKSVGLACDANAPVLRFLAGLIVAAEPPQPLGAVPPVGCACAARPAATGPAVMR